MDTEEEKIADALRVSGRQVSMDAPFTEGEETGLLDVLANEDSPMADSELVSESLMHDIELLLDRLNQRERDIVQASFGIDCREMSLEEIADKLDLTRERVRQIKDKAIRKLRGSDQSKRLKNYLG